jgi:uncharacterized protein YggE
VTGAAEIQITPDTVSLSLGVETKGSQLDAVRADNARQTTQVRTVLKDFGIPDHQIQSSHLNILPRYDPIKQTPKDYIVQRTLTVTYQDLRRFEDLLIALLEDGVVKVRGLRFGHSQLESQQTEVRVLALNDARNTAEALAEEFDQVLGPPLEIVDVAVPSASAERRGLSAESAVNNTLAPGKMTVRAHVKLTFQLQDLE